MADGRAKTSPENGRKGGGPKGARGPQIHRKRAAERLLRDAELNAENTIEAIRRGAFPDIGALFDDAGNLRPISELTEAERWNIAGLEVVIKNAAAGDGVTDRVLKLKWADRARYVEMAAKYHALLTERIDVNVTDLGAKLDTARERARQRNAKPPESQ